MADSFGIWQKTTEFYKAIILQLKNRKYHKLSNKSTLLKKKIGKGEMDTICEKAKT